MATAPAMDDGADFPPPVAVPASACTPAAVVRFLIDWLVADGRLPPREVEATVGGVLRRESLGSTGVGRGLAIPHATGVAVSDIVTVVGRLAAPVDWGAVDGQPVRLVALVLAPRSGDTVRMLEEALRRLR